MTRNRNNNGSYRPNNSKGLVISSGVTTEWIKSFYANYDCSKHRQKCACCQKREPFDGEEFNACSGCQLIVYCSKECQKAHWKDHKEFCQQNSCSADCAYVQRAQRKMEKFQALYYPLIELMIHLRLALLARELDLDLDTIQNTHTINLYLADVPDEFADANKPKIMIKHMQPLTFAQCDPNSRLDFEKTRGAILHQGFVVSYTFVYPCIETGQLYSNQQSCIHSRDPFYYFRRYNKLEMLQKIMWLTQGINGMAKGTRPDIYKEVKRFLKEDGGRRGIKSEDDITIKRKNRARNNKKGAKRG